MARLYLNQVEPGMALAAQVNNLHGQMLLAAGSYLTPRHLGVLQAWGVAEVEIVSNHVEPKPRMEIADDLATLVARGELKKIFRRQNLDCPMIHELFEVCVARRARRGGFPATSLGHET